MLSLWLIASVLKMQRALHWWFKRQSDQLWYQSDQIRNGLMQEIFTIRRSLELSLADGDQAMVQDRQTWLQQIEHLHDSLEQLSDRLTPPYLEDSLPLAIQALAELWRADRPAVQIDSELPLDWPVDSLELNRVILSTLGELFQSVVTGESTVSIKLQLQAKRHWGVLKVQVTYPDEATLTTQFKAQDADRLAEVFQLLTLGWCCRQRQDLTMIWQFHWRLPNHPENLVNSKL